MSAPWLFSRNIDLAVFGGTAVVALAAAAAPLDDTPSWIWLAAVLFVDVAHVHATLFRTYLDRAELQRRPLLYTFTPIFCFVMALALYQAGPLLFWRCAAYLAVFHFVRQQYGWVALYRRRAGETGTSGRVIDGAAIYASTLYPLYWWHTHLPRRFSWFVADDFVRIPQIPFAAQLYALILIVYAVRAFFVWNPGKHLVVATTALCWYVGIVGFNTDYAFTVTNVLIHGVPYFALIYFYGRANRTPVIRRFGLAGILGLVWVLAFIEEAAWDHTLWHDHAEFFGAGFSLGAVAAWLVPLLAVPQLTHYVLDGFIWRRVVIPSGSEGPGAGERRSPVDFAQGLRRPPVPGPSLPLLRNPRGTRGSRFEVRIRR